MKRADSLSLSGVMRPILLAWFCLTLTCMLSLAQFVPGPEQVLYAFKGGTDGAVPMSVLIMDSSGNLYGTTQEGGSGTCGCGTVFELSPNSKGGWTEIILYSFQGQGSNDGAGPSSGLIFDQAGNLYGTTSGGGALDQGAVFELSPNGGGGWTETVLYSFQGNDLGNTDGAWPSGNLTLDKSKNLYGTTENGGDPDPACDAFFVHIFSGCGTVFELSPNGSGGWTETVLYRFPAGGAEGYNPNGGLVFDQSGNLYGTTAFGGSGPCQFTSANSGCGTVFEVSPGVSSWTETVLYNFLDQGDGEGPQAGAIFDGSGNLYGTAGGGTVNANCTSGCGIVFEFSPNGSGGWTETILHSFQGSDGSDPNGVLILDQSGSLYGVAGAGTGSNPNPGYPGPNPGMVFELSPNGSSSWTETVLYNFQGFFTNNDGANPAGGVIFDQAGHLYGNTYGGGGAGNACGNPGCGTVFEVFREPFVAFGTFSSFGNQIVGIPTSPQALTLTNNGNLPLTITSIQITGVNSSDFSESNNCPSSLSAAASCTINVTFTPAALGNRTASVSVTDNAPGSPQALALSGIGVAPAITLSPSSLTFPSQYVGTTGLPQNVTLSNTGVSAVTISSVTTSADFAATSGCGNMVQPGISCSIGVFFDPTTSGTRSGTLTVVDNGSATPQTVALTGMGQDFSMAASSSSSATVTAGQTATYTVAVAPVGGFSQTVALSCSGAPAQSTCSVSPSSVKLSGSSPASVTVTVTTAGASASLANPAGLPRSGNRLALWLALPGLSGLVLLSGSVRCRRRVSGMLYILALLCLLSVGITWSGCGGSSSSSGGGSGTPAGTYNLTVTGAFTSGSTTLTHNTKLTLVVQ
jgi:uncharacterized repeat protein (TIGR03803 family)